MSGYPHKLPDIRECQLRIIDRNPNSSTARREIGQVCVDAIHLTSYFCRIRLLVGAVSTGPVTDLQRNAGSSDIQVLRTRVTRGRGGVAKGYLPGKPESHLVRTRLDVGNGALRLEGALCVCSERHCTNGNQCDRAPPDP